MTPIVRHAALMAAGLLLVFTALFVAATLRRKRWWLLLHRSAGLAGTSVILLGAIAAVAAIAFSTGRHLRVPHTWLGAVTIATALVVPVLGLLQSRIRTKAGTFRTFHRFCGRFLAGAAFATLLLGLRLTGIL
ncbi:MAG: hypothetical protein KKA48_04885 [Proteobacteria bacterium]|nr:hypothetical protein [Pseudomonadota bacterium]